MQRDVQESTSVRVGREAAFDLRAIALDLSRAERRHVSLGEVVSRLIAAWRAGTGRAA